MLASVTESDVFECSERLAQYLELCLGGKDSADHNFVESQRLLQILATSSNECFQGAEAAAVMVCGDPADLTAPVRAAEAVAKSNAPFLLISGGAGQAGTKPLYEAAKTTFKNPDFNMHADGKAERVPVPKGMCSAGKPMDVATANSYLTEADIYAAIVLQKLIESHGFKRNEIQISHNTNCLDLKRGSVKLNVVIENRSTHSGENAQFSEELLRDYLKTCTKPKVIFVKGPLLLLRGVLTMRKEKGTIVKSEWLGGCTQVVAYAEACPNLTRCSPLGRLEALAQGAGELSRIVKYNGMHLDVEPGFPSDKVGIIRNLEQEFQRLLKEAGGKQGCGTS